MSDTDKSELDNQHFFSKIETILWLIHTAKNEDKAEIAIQNVLEHINSTMTRNSQVKKQCNQARLDELDKFGEVEFNEVPMDIIQYRYGRRAEIQAQAKETEGE
jgi:hypothetical protein